MVGAAVVGRSAPPASWCFDSRGKWAEDEPGAAVCWAVSNRAAQGSVATWPWLRAPASRSSERAESLWAGCAEGSGAGIPPQRTSRERFVAMLRISGARSLAGNVRQKWSPFRLASGSLGTCRRFSRRTATDSFFTATNTAPFMFTFGMVEVKPFLR